MNKLPQEIVIVGGGTAGWMTACYLARTAELMANNSNVPACAPKITLLESAVISTVGVGEGSTPYLRHFFEFLGINESEWMLKCSATYKMGISFERWTATAESKTTRPLFTESDSYFHPFFSSLDIPTADMYFNAVNEYRKGASHDINPSHYFTAAHMVEKSITPDAICSSANIDYAYHFDAGLLGDFLKEYALNKGVSHQIGTVANVESHEHTINSLKLDDGNTLSADFFIDCSGFRGLLGKQALSRKFISYADTLFNDAAVAIASDATASPETALQTRSIALSHGWQWHIPLTSRTGNGYVYSSQFCTATQAEEELRLALEPDQSHQQARHLKMTVGRLEEHWKGNCLCIGLSQGFIEPLEATALMLVQYALHHFIDCWQSTNPRRVERYNSEINRMFDGIRDYIAAHYYLNTRDDSAYWVACREDLKVPDTLSYLLNAWDKGASFEHALNEVDNKLVYLRPSWYCIFAGMKRFSNNSTPLAHPNTLALRTMQQSVDGAYRAKQH